MCMDMVNLLQMELNNIEYAIRKTANKNIR